ncbi:MAG: phosphatase PAP2 family protein [Bacteroidia bacterium]
MKQIFKDNISFLFPYLVYIIVGAFVLVFNTKIDLHLTLNNFHTPFFDSLFYYFTYLGDGFMALITVIILLTIKYRYALITAIASLISAGITQTLKHTIYDDVVRPKKFFEGVQELYLVPGVDNHLYNSFPSGHATSAFALFFSLALITKSHSLKILLFIVAILTAYSRIYLSQHFFEDVYAGSLIGLTTTIVVYYIIKINHKHWMENSVLQLFKNE